MSAHADACVSLCLCSCVCVCRPVMHICAWLSARAYQHQHAAVYVHTSKDTAEIVARGATPTSRRYACEARLSRGGMDNVTHAFSFCGLFAVGRGRGQCSHGEPCALQHEHVPQGEPCVPLEDCSMGVLTSCRFGSDVGGPAGVDLRVRASRGRGDYLFSRAPTAQSLPGERFRPAARLASHQISGGFG